MTCNILKLCICKKLKIWAKRWKILELLISTLQIIFIIFCSHSSSMGLSYPPPESLRIMWEWFCNGFLNCHTWLSYQKIFLVCKQKLNYFWHNKTQILLPTSVSHFLFLLFASFNLQPIVANCSLLNFSIYVSSFVENFLLIFLKATCTHWKSTVFLSYVAKTASTLCHRVVIFYSCGYQVFSQLHTRSITVWF